MSVYAGFGGQKFINDSVQKIGAVFEETKRLGRDIPIEVDGGINAETAALCAEKGATVFVAGSYVFNSTDYRERIEAVRNGALQGQQRGH